MNKFLDSQMPIPQSGLVRQALEPLLADWAVKADQAYMANENATLDDWWLVAGLSELVMPAKGHCAEAHELWQQVLDLIITQATKAGDRLNLQSVDREIENPDT